ncbi:MAG: SPOR domain-containing protein [Pseudomonadales bacterium]|nr:SPOR domain-containing protein [Pseudomonadales bacterium]
MTQDYAKKNSKKIAAANAESPRWRWLITGFVLGLFSAFLIYLWHEIPSDQNSTISNPTADIIKQIGLDEQAIDFTFYDIFPKANVPIFEKYNANGNQSIDLTTDSSSGSPQANYIYALQAGSFKKLDDANRRRGQIILLNMPVIIKQITKDNAIWHRVMVTPIESKLALNRARAQLANANIESIQLRLKQ